MLYATDLWVMKYYSEMVQAEVAADKDLRIKPTNVNTGFVVRHLTITNTKRPGNVKQADTRAIHELSSSTGVDLFINTVSDEMQNASKARIGQAKFFNMHNYGKINFTGQNPGRQRGYSLYGDLTISGVSRKIKLDVDFEGIKADPNGARNPVFLIRGSICRADWGSTWAPVLKTSGFLINEELRISCEVHLTDEQRLPYYYSFFYSIYSSQLNSLVRRKSYFMGG